MEPSTSSSNGSEEIATETFHFSDDIQSLMTENVLQHSFDSPPEHEMSFTTLLGLPANQALKLLRKPESSDPPEIPSDDIWRNQTSVPFSVPTFPLNAGAARFSIFARESPATSSDPSISTRNSPKLKTEPADSDSNPNSSLNFWGSMVQINGRRCKRKEAEKGKVKTPAKRSKSDEDEKLKKKRAEQEHKESEKLPYVHVRALRGQATDNHSLAERARREKINARMKLLQELVPGCSKISGTALVLDEIINHVQSLQRQIEFLSMRLAAVNPRLDFSNLDSFFFSEDSSLMAGCLAGLMAEVSRPPF